MAQNTSFLDFLKKQSPQTPQQAGEFFGAPTPTQAPPTMAGPVAPTPLQMQGMEPSTAPTANQAPPTMAAPAAPYKYGDPAPYPAAEGQDFFGLNAGAVPLANPDGSYRAMPEQSDVPVMSAGTVTREDLRMSPSGILTEQKTPFEIAVPAIYDAVGTKRMSSEQYRAQQPVPQIAPEPAPYSGAWKGAEGFTQENLFGAPRVGTAPRPEIQQPQGLTTISGAPLNEFLSGAAMPDQGFARAENAMYGDNSLSRGLGGDAATKAFQDASEARDARLGFDNRPGVDAPSLAMQRSRMDAGLDPVEGAPTGTDMSQQQQRDALERGFDPATGQPIKGTGSAKEDAEIGKIRAETAEILSKIGEKGTELNLSPAELARDKAAGATLNKWDDSGRATIESNITSLNEVIGGLESGQIKTRGFIDALPFGADWARAIMNPTGQDAKDRVQGVIFQTLRETLGAQFTEKEGQRLVEASYNVKLSPEQNAARLRDYTTGLKRAAEARESQMRYLKENKTLSGYEGPTPSSVMSQVGAGGEGGSPIKGDIDYQSDIQSSATEIMNSK